MCIGCYNLVCLPWNMYIFSMLGRVVPKSLLAVVTVLLKDFFLASIALPNQQTLPKVKILSMKAE